MGGVDEFDTGFMGDLVLGRRVAAGSLVADRVEFALRARGKRGLRLNAVLAGGDVLQPDGGRRRRARRTIAAAPTSREKRSAGDRDGQPCGHLQDHLSLHSKKTTLASHVSTRRRPSAPYTLHGPAHCGGTEPIAPGWLGSSAL